MAKHVLDDVLVYINSVDLSDHCNEADLALMRDILENTDFGSSSKSKIMGLKDSSLTLNFDQDFAASKVDATLYAAWDAGVAVPVRIRFDGTSAISATNPEYQVDMLVPEYHPISGSIGQSHRTSLTLQGTGDVTRDVTA